MQQTNYPRNNVPTKQQKFDNRLAPTNKYDFTVKGTFSVRGRHLVLKGENLISFIFTYYISLLLYHIRGKYITMPNSPWQDQLHVYSLFRDFLRGGNIARGKIIYKSLST